MPTANLALEGKHNIKNAMAASTVAQLLNIRKHTIRESLEKGTDMSSKVIQQIGARLK